METGLGTPMLNIRDFFSENYNQLYMNHSIHMCNFALPSVNYFYKNFDQYVNYDKGTPYCESKEQLKKIYASSNLVAYGTNVNPLNRYMHSIKGHVFLPGGSLNQFKNVEFYCENLMKQLRKDMKKASPSICDVELLPTNYGIYFNLYSKVPSLSLELFSDLCKSMATLSGSSYVKTLHEDTVRTNLGKQSVLDLAHHQLVCGLNLYVDAWEGNLSLNFLRVNDIAKQNLYSKTVLFFLGGFNLEDCKKKAEYYSNNFCYQKKDFYMPNLPKYSILQPKKPIVLQREFEGKSKNSAMLYFYQTRVFNFFEFYDIKDQSLVKSKKYTTYEVAKMYTMLAHHFLQVEYFQTLRSKQSLGYHVYSRIIFKDGMLGVGYFVQSSENSPAVLAAKTEQFIVSEASKPGIITQEKINANIKAVLRKPTDRTYQYPDVLNKLQEIFYCNKKMTDTIKAPNIYNEDFTISESDFKSFFKNFYIDKPCTMEVHILGSDHGESQKNRLSERQGKVYNIPANVRASLSLSHSEGYKFFDNWAETTGK